MSHVKASFKAGVSDDQEPLIADSEISELFSFIITETAGTGAPTRVTLYDGLSVSSGRAIASISVPKDESFEASFGVGVTMSSGLTVEINEGTGDITVIHAG